MNIVVLCGGLSMERDVSLSSGTMICRALRAGGHRAVLVDLFMGLPEGTIDRDLFADLPPIREVRVPEGQPDLNAVRASRPWKSPSVVGPGVLELCQKADVVFLGLHGACGEDGRIQAALDLLGIPYTGSGHLASALAMDKHMTKVLAVGAGIRTPAWRKVTYAPEDIDALVDDIPLPCVIKPVDSGSSVGVSIPHTRGELRRALKDNAHLGVVLAEAYVQGREIDVAVLDGRALPSIEIIPGDGFYDYKNKYQPGAAREICPTPVSEAVERQLGEMALRIHTVLGLRDYSRSDFMLDADGNIWFLEINTLPGMTPTSLLPQEAKAAGIDYQALCERLVQLAVERKQGL